MKKLTLLIAAAFIAAMTLTSCEPDIESSGWLKGTTWKADLAGKQIIWNDFGIEHKSDITEGFISIRFSGSGYTMRASVSGNSEFRVQQITKIFPDYDYPSLMFPYPYKTKDGQELVEYSTGVISEDLRSIHFDSFVIGYQNTGDGSFWTVRDVIFTR